MADRLIIFRVFGKGMTPELQRHLQYGAGYLELKMHEDAIREAESALALDPACSQALAIKSTALWETNRLAEAEPVIARLAESNPKNSGVWINLAYIRRRTQSLDAAVATLQHAFDANPRDALAHFNMACYRAVQERSEEAIELLQNALRLDPKLANLARIEHDFDTLRELPAFKKLVNGHNS
jgi:tetratricopeptide (TPR) repeat protein